MKAFAKWIDQAPWILKLIFALPCLDGIVYGIYRICKGHLIAGIIWIFFGIWLFWVIDLICVILYGKVTVFA